MSASVVLLFDASTYYPQLIEIMDCFSGPECDLYHRLAGWLPISPGLPGSSADAVEPGKRVVRRSGVAARVSCYRSRCWHRQPGCAATGFI